MKWIGIVAAVGIAALTFTSPPALPPPKATPAAVAVPPPLRCVVFLDQTRSRDEARIVASLADFAPLFERLRTSGGELAIGVIRDNSNKPLARCYIPEPPSPPAPPPSPTNGNIFIKATARKRYDDERKKYAAKKRAHDAAADRDIDAFITIITPLFKAPASARATDVTTAIQRADLMLAEPSPFTRQADAVIVLVSDAIHNATPFSVRRLRSNSRLVVVNGIGSLGVVENFTPAPVPFESTAAAIRYISNINGGAHAR